MAQEPSRCETHGMAFVRLRREVTGVEEYNEETKQYEASDRDIPKRCLKVDYLCPLCDG